MISKILVLKPSNANLTKCFNHQNIVFFKSAIKFSIFALEKHHLPNIHCKNENLLSFHMPLTQIERVILYHRIDF